MTGLREGQITASLRGSAGQSLGAFAVQGLRLDVIGDANDYVGKGLSGGMITVRPGPSARFVADKNTIIGNTVLYGATSGLLLANGQAGERFCVRNSGAMAVVEGCGSNGCEYMTGGTVVILGSTGENFGAGMTGGMAFIYDPKDLFFANVNPETLEIRRVNEGYWQGQLHEIVSRHALETGSALAKQLLNDWASEVNEFWHVVPTETLSVLSHPISEAELSSQTA
jgi:glutamate synthase (NADPH/NADH) large chain